MKSYWREYIIFLLAWVGATCLWVLIRFVGLSSVPAFATLDYESLNHTLLFRKAVIVGSVIGTLFFFINQAIDTPKIRQRPYAVLIMIQMLSAILFVTLVLVGLSLADLLASNEEFKLSVFKSRLINVNFFVILIYYILVSFILVMIKQIDRMFGPGNLRKLIIGAFYHPREVELIFMFLDLKDSTTHAERLGHLKFANLIQDCFMDKSAVVAFGAKFYQYIGDESILFWDVDEGIQNANCLRAYYAFTHRLEERRDYYESKYGVMPEFKAGVNIGLATVLEVGDIKRDIAYLGDVLNTAARIQGQCSVYGENLIISGSLLKRFKSIPDHIDIDAIGETNLKGRSEAVHLYRVRERPESE